MSDTADLERIRSLETRLAKADAAIVRLRRMQLAAMGVAFVALMLPLFAMNGCASVRFKRLRATEITLVDRTGHAYAEITNDDGGAKMWLEPVQKGPRVELAASAANADAYVTAKSGVGTTTMFVSSGRLSHASVDVLLEDAWTRMSVDPMGKGESAVVWAHTDLFDGRLDAHDPSEGDRYLEISAEAPNVPKAKAAMKVDDHGGVFTVPSCVAPASAASTQ